MNPPPSEAIVRPIEAFDTSDDIDGDVRAVYPIFSKDREYHVTLYVSGAMTCTCPWESYGNGAKARCKHITGLMQSMGIPTPWAEEKQQKVIAAAVQGTRRAIERASKRQADLDGSTGRKLNAHSLHVWYSEKFQAGAEDCRARILRFIIENGPCSRNDVERGLRMRISTVCGRMDELKQGLISYACSRQDATTGNPVECFVAESHVSASYRALRGSGI
jgi:hypothetical protein